MPAFAKNSRHEVRFNLNGEEVEGYAEPRMLLSDFLRHEIGATGTHVGCEHGICGACTVRIDGEPARSCLTLAMMADGKQVETVEGLADDDGTMSPLQQAFHEHFALQCGYCTPGILVTLQDFLEKNPKPSEREVRIALSGNICRCTDYSEIVDAVMSVTGQGG